MELSDYELRRLPYRGRGLASFTKLVDDIIPFIESLEAEPVRILEVGCGYGQLLIELVYHFGKKVVCFGINKPGFECNIDIALRIAKHRGAVPADFSIAPGNINFVFCDAGEELPFDQFSFDLVISQVCIAYIPEKLFFLTEVSRILKIKGKAFLHVEFEHSKDGESDEANWVTLMVNDGPHQVDLKDFFCQYPQMNYVRKLSGSVLRIDGGAIPQFDVGMEYSTELTDKDVHGVISVYSLTVEDLK